MTKIYEINNEEEFFIKLGLFFDKKYLDVEKKQNPENYSVQTVSKIIGCTDLTTYSYIKKGFIPATKIGRKYIINSTDLENALKDVKSLKYRR